MNVFQWWIYLLSFVLTFQTIIKLFVRLFYDIGLKHSILRHPLLDHNPDVALLPKLSILSKLQWRFFHLFLHSLSLTINIFPINYLNIRQKLVILFGFLANKRVILHHLSRQLRKHLFSQLLRIIFVLHILHESHHVPLTRTTIFILQHTVVVVYQSHQLPLLIGIVGNADKNNADGKFTTLNDQINDFLTVVYLSISQNHQNSVLLTNFFHLFALLNTVTNQRSNISRTRKLEKRHGITISLY